MSYASALPLGAPGSSPAPEATLERGAPRENSSTGHEFMKQTSSAPSSLDFGVESFQFHAGVFDTKLPIDAALFAVRLVRPGCNFSLQYGQFTDAAVAETLAP